MENKAARRILISLIVVVGIIMGWQILQARCYELSKTLDITTPFNITYLYPRPDAKISFACHLLAYSKSPFAPRRIYYAEDVIREDGFPIRNGRYREGAIVVRIAIIDELYHQFPEQVRTGSVPPFATAVSLYVDGRKLQIGHIGYRGFDNEFNFATILNPLLWPGGHVGKIVVLLPSGETLEYEWNFEITWW